MLDVDRSTSRTTEFYQIEHRDFHHALIEVSGSIFDNLYRHDLLGFKILAFYHLAKGTLTKNVED